MSENTKTDIPEGELHDIHEETALDVPALPGEWEWGASNRVMTSKVNVYFGLNIMETGGWYGEIDNYVHDGEELWTVHVRPIVDVPGEDRNRPRREAETAEEFTSLAVAIDAVPVHIGTHYEDE